MCRSFGLSRSILYRERYSFLKHTHTDFLNDDAVHERRTKAISNSSSLSSSSSLSPSRDCRWIHSAKRAAASEHHLHYRHYCHSRSCQTVDVVIILLAVNWITNWFLFAGGWFYYSHRYCLCVCVCARRVSHRERKTRHYCVLKSHPLSSRFNIQLPFFMRFCYIVVGAIIWIAHNLAHYSSRCRIYQKWNQGPVWGRMYKDWINSVKIHDENGWKLIKWVMYSYLMFPEIGTSYCCDQ